MNKLFAVLQTFAADLNDRVCGKTEDPDAGMESVQIVVITALGLVIVLAVMAAITGVADEYIARLT